MRQAAAGTRVAAQMFNQVRMVVELLRQMIVGEQPIDLKLARFCGHKLSSSNGCPQIASDLIDKMLMLDEAHLFRAPPLLVDGIRREALDTLSEAETRAAFPTSRQAF